MLGTTSTRLPVVLALAYAGCGPAVVGDHVSLSGASPNTGPVAEDGPPGQGDASEYTVVGTLDNERTWGPLGALIGGPPTSYGLSAADAYLPGRARDTVTGTAINSAGDQDGDGYDDIVLLAPAHRGGGGSSGGAWIVNGPFSGEVDLNHADALINGTHAEDYMGHRGGTTLGDVNNDGYDDLGLGAWGADDNGLESGAGYVVYGPYSGSFDVTSNADTVMLGAAAGDLAGWGAIDRAGDVDGDGYDDVVLAAGGEATAGVDAGAIYLVYGPGPATMTLNSADAKLTGAAAGDIAGFAIYGGADLSGDGTPDLLVGAPMNDGAGTDTGAAYMVEGPLSGTSSLSSADAIMQGTLADECVGKSVSSVGDVDNDGYDDVLVGAWEHEDADGIHHCKKASDVYLVFGPVAGTSSLASADAIFSTTDAGDWIGWAANRFRGDMSGDGVDDLVIGAPGNDMAYADAGTTFIVNGPVGSGSHVLDTYADVAWNGQAVGDYAGAYVASAGDVNRDGIEDLLIGAPFHKGNGPDSGAGYMVLGGP